MAGNTRKQGATMKFTSKKEYQLMSDKEMGLAKALVTSKWIP